MHLLTKIPRDKQNKLLSSSLQIYKTLQTQKTEWGASKKYYNGKILSSLKLKVAQKHKSERKKMCYASLICGSIVGEC